MAGTEGSQEDSQDAAREEPRPRPGAADQGKRGHEVDTEQKTGDTGTDMGGTAGCHRVMGTQASACVIFYASENFKHNNI